MPGVRVGPAPGAVAFLSIPIGAFSSASLWRGQTRARDAAEARDMEPVRRMAILSSSLPERAGCPVHSAEPGLLAKRTTGHNWAAKMRARHMVGLVNEFFRYSIVNRTWWLIPVMVLMATMLLLITIGQAAAPYSLYAFF
jgi:hypothetical protein